MEDLVKKLRKRLTEYRYARINKTIGKDVSIHVNAIDIALSLVEYALDQKRAITDAEANWFDAGLYMAYIFQGSEWEDLYDLYKEMCTEVRNLNFFREF